MDSIFISNFLDRIYRIIRIFLPGFPDESLVISIALGDQQAVGLCTNLFD
jgi:hypothetical protein